MFHGSMVALVTPMHEDGSLDVASLRGLVEFHITNRTDALVVVGTTGESATLDEHEHCAIIRQVVEMVAGRLPVIAGTGANSTREAIALTRCAMQAGADACLLVTPYYNRPTQHGLFLHHQAVAEAVPIPQILYNVPSRTGCDMLPETVQKLAGVPNIIGVKEATGSLERAQEIMARCGDTMSVYAGDDATGMEMLLLGAKGIISVTANVAPRLMSEMCVAASSNDRSRATAINEQLAALHRDLFIESNPIPVKWALQQMGLISSGIRLPLTLLSESCQPEVRQAMRQANLNL